MAQENDIVLIYIENLPQIFARIEDILPDNKRDWYHVTLLLLQLPVQTVTWILKDIYINGEEFTMNGKKMRLEKVENPDKSIEKKKTSTSSNQKSKKSDGAEIISFPDFNKE